MNRESLVTIEGFPRSGNSRLVAIATELIGDDRRVASHVHSFAHVSESLRIGIPTYVVIRDPVDCIASMLVFDNAVSPETLMNEYERFYSQVRSTSAVVVPFSLVITTGFIGRFAGQLGVAPPVDLPSFEVAVADRLRWMASRADNLDPRRIGSPSPRRSADLDNARRLLLGTHLRRIESLQSLALQLIEGQ